jgi:hypothetical protein
MACWAGLLRRLMSTHHEGSNPLSSAVAGSGVGFRKQIVTLPVSGSIPLGHLFVWIHFEVGI